jgi:hypothetical protein
MDFLLHSLDVTVVADVLFLNPFMNPFVLNPFMTNPFIMVINKFKIMKFSIYLIVLLIILNKKYIHLFILNSNKEVILSSYKYVLNKPIRKT